MSSPSLVSIVTGVTATAKPRPDVQGALVLTSGGTPRACLSNVATILRGEPAFVDGLAFNAFDKVVYLNGRRLTDEAVTNIATWLGDVYDLLLRSSAVVYEVILAVARDNEFDPVRDYLDQLEWDGESRIEDFAVRYLGANDELSNVMCMRFLISAVARVYEPGCKADCMLILVGFQGVGKSTAISVVAVREEWYNDTSLDFRSKDIFSVIHGTWLCEVAELDGFRRADGRRIKALLSSRQDRFRPPYARNAVVLLRRTVFVGTTNESSFLSDPSGARRFWPVQVGRIDVEALRRDVDQLWAEAVVAYRDGEQWHLTEDEEQMHKQAVEGYREVDPWEDPIDQWVARQSAEFTISDVLQALEVQKDRRISSHQQRVAVILRLLGCKYIGQRRLNGRKGRWWRPPSGKPRPRRGQFRRR